MEEVHRHWQLQRLDEQVAAALSGLPLRAAAALGQLWVAVGSVSSPLPDLAEG